MPQPAEIGPSSAAGKQKSSNTLQSTFRNQTPGSDSQTSAPKRGFHLVIPATEKDPRLCKTLLSALILDYPPPTLVNFNRTFRKGSPYRDTHLSKIRGILDFLSNARIVKPDDLVLVVDGYDVWFQLPPELLFKRYHHMVSTANERLKREYVKPWWQALQRHGASSSSSSFSSSSSVSAKRPGGPRASVIFGADKLCWPNPSTDPACACVPNSTLPSDAWGPETDGHPGGWLNRPRYLNSGTFIGPARDLKALYQYAAFKVESGGRDMAVSSDQFVLGEIFGEQECQRTAMKTENNKGGALAHMRQWLVDIWATATKRRGAAGSQRPAGGDDTAPPLSSSSPRRPYEFGIALDYEMALFQTMTHSGGDVEIFRLNDSAAVMSRLYTSSSKLDTITAARTAGSDPSSSFLSSFFADIASLPSPYHRQPRAGVPISALFNASLPSDDEEEAHGNNDDVSAVGEGGGGGGGTSGGGGNGWARVPLAVNTHAPSVPVLLHLNGDKALLDAWWPRMWWHAHGRALLRLRVGGQHNAATAAPTAAQRPWADDFRGGAGGAWMTTTHAGGSSGTDRWLSWSDVCAGYEDAVFGDGRGEWGREDAASAADGKLRTEWGEVKADVELGVW